MARRQRNTGEKVKVTKAGLLDAISIFRYIKPYLGYFIGGMLFLVLGTLVFLGVMQLPGEMVNTALGKESRYDFTVGQYGLVFFIFLLAQGIFSYFRTIFFAVVSEKGMADLRKDLYSKMITQSITFFEERRVGELTSRITADVEQLQSAFSVTLAEFLRQVVILLGGILFIAILTPRLSLIMLLTFPAIVILAMIFGRYIRKLSRKRQDHLAKTNTIVEETFQSFSAVKAFANEWYESVRYGNSVDDIVSVSLAFARVRGLFFIFIITVLFGGIFFILWRGAILVQEGNMEAGDLFTFIIYTGILGGAIASFGSLYTSLAQAIGATERIQAILKRDQEVNIHDGKKEDNLQIDGNINYREVSFSYPTRKDVPVLRGVNIDVEAGHKIALVGQSGSGKSTIVQLLMRFYEVDGGTITIDGKDLKEFNLTAYRKNIGIVPQEVILFGGSIRENILYGKPDASEAELIDAARRSNSLDFIESFPEGFDTLVGERGIKLSGGQRQRIAIARAILKDPAILILDEATSSLDAESEKAVQDALDALMKGRTSIIIAHRLSTIRDVDTIYVLEDGRIIEQGSHDVLSIKEDGAYSNLARLQFDLK